MSDIIKCDEDRYLNLDHVIDVTAEIDDGEVILLIAEMINGETKRFAGVSAVAVAKALNFRALMAGMADRAIPS